MPKNSSRQIGLALALSGRGFVTVSIALMLLITGCSGSNVDGSKPIASSPSPSENVQSTLTIAAIPVTSESTQKEQKQTLTDYLSKTLNRPVLVQFTKDYDTAVDLLVQEKVQVALLGPLSYVEARQRNPQVEPIAAPVNKITQRPWYKSAIVVNSASGIKTISDLKGKRIGFVSKLSASGYMVPTVKLLDIGLDPRSYFSSVEFYGSHDKNLDALLNGKADAIAIDKNNYLRAKEAGKVNDSYQIIWESEPIPESPVVVSKKLSSQLIADIRQAFINAPTGLLDITGNPSNGYTLVEDSTYEPIRRIKQQIDTKLGQPK